MTENSLNVFQLRGESVFFFIFYFRLISWTSWNDHNLPSRLVIKTSNTHPKYTAAVSVIHQLAEPRRQCRGCWRKRKPPSPFCFSQPLGGRGKGNSSRDDGGKGRKSISRTAPSNLLNRYSSERVSVSPCLFFARK